MLFLKIFPAKLEEYAFQESYEGTTNVLGLVVFAIVLGVSLGKLGPRGKPLLTFFESLSEAMMVITRWVIWLVSPPHHLSRFDFVFFFVYAHRLSPLGVFFLVAAKVMETESFADLVGRLGLYFVTVMLGLFLHGFGTLAIIFFVCTRTLPYKFIMNLSQVLVTAFGTASR